MASGPSPKKRKKPESASFPRGVVLWVWLIALTTLGGLIYWGISAKPERPYPQTTAQKRQAAAAKPFDHRETAKPRAAAQQGPAQTRGAVEKPASEPRKPVTSAHPEADHRHDLDTGNLLAAHRPDASVREPSEPISPPQPPAPTPPVARVAIVIDDFGQNLEIARSFLQVPLDLTFSVLPYQRHSEEIAALAHEHHRQVILHLPMEPHGYPKINPGKGALLLSMSDAAIQESFRTAMDVSPYFSGINNHMGSHFTENTRVMRTVIEETKKRQLYFIDSYTSPRSVASSLAREVQLPFLRRDIFLDNQQSESAIRSQLRQLRRRAKIQGAALAIGHPHEATLRALRHEADEFGREKIAVVPAGELLPGS